MIIMRSVNHDPRWVARKLRITEGTVRKWIGRWNAAFDSFVIAIREMETERQLIARIETILADAPRSGRPPGFTPEQVARIVQLACTPPGNFKLPIARWTVKDLARECMKQGIVEKISPATVHRLLNSSDVKPHLVKQWLNAAPEDPATFVPRVTRLTDLYLRAQELKAAGTRVACIDEKPGIQALEPLHPPLPMKPGLVERREFDYRRHGTTCAIASFEPATGSIIGLSVGPTRTEADFLAHVARTVDTDPGARWVIVTDQLNTHKSESLVRFVAERCSITADLGKKECRGILKSLETRAAFLEDESHRIRFVYTPKHCSWLNQVECWFSILSRKALRNESFASIPELERRIREFTRHYNATMAKPFRWTYTGRPLAAA